MLVDKTIKNNFAEFVHCVQQRFQFPVKENAFVSVHQHARGWGGGKVLQISSDRDDLMGAKLRTDKIPRAPKKTPKTSQDHNKPQ